MCVCVCVCMHVCMYMYIYIYSNISSTQLSLYRLSPTTVCKIILLVCVDKDRDNLGIAMVEANKTKLGEWQYLDSSGVWKSIALTENKISREAEIIGESAKLIFLAPGQKIRFKPIVKTKLWTAGEGMDYTTARFVCWDQSNELNSGLHTVSLKGVLGWL